MSNRQQSFEANGFSLERGFLCREKIHDIAAELLRRVEIQLSYAGLSIDCPGPPPGEGIDVVQHLSRQLIRLEKARPGSQARIYDEVNRMPTMFALACNPRLIALAKELCSADIAIHTRLNMIMAMPGDEWHIAVWHQDGFYGPSNHFVAYIPLQPTGAHNGGLRIAPGMHRDALLEHVPCHAEWGVESKFHTLAPELVSSFPEDRQLELEAGDLLCFDRWLPHTASINRSNEVRFAITIRYVDLADPEFASRGWTWRDDAQVGLQALASPKPAGA